MISIPFLWNALVMDWIGNQCIGVHCIPMQFIPGQGTLPTPVPGKEQRGTGRFHYTAGNESDHGGDSHGPMRCLRRGTGTARPRSPHGLRQDPLPHRRPGLLPPPPHHQCRGGRRRHRRGENRRRNQYRRHQRQWVTGGLPFEIASSSRKWGASGVLLTINVRHDPVQAV